MLARSLVEPLMGIHSKGSLLAFPENIRQVLKWPIVSNTLAYRDTESITSAESFIVQTSDI
jgi:hypothetical protein